MKMDSLSEHNIPWDLIADSLQPDFPAEEDARLQQWLAESTANRETYQRARELWAVRLADFSAYQAADEATAWDSLMQQLQEKTTAPVVSNSSRFTRHGRRYCLVPLAGQKRAGLRHYYYTKGDRFARRIEYYHAAIYRSEGGGPL
jgi:ferric-dicitrate binding protein FerR (iron transport regulator)